MSTVEEPPSKKQKVTEEVEAVRPGTSVDLKGKWALITGAGSGIGEAVAEAYAQAGLNLVLVGRTQSKLEEVQASVTKQHPAHCRVHTCDLGDMKQVDKLVQSILVQQKLEIDVLVNNAGMHCTGNAQQGDPDEWDNMLAVNLLAPMRLTRALAPPMVERGWGVIVNIGSIAGTEPMTSSGAYAASKYGLRGWSLSTWANLRHQNVKVCLINPAFVNTPMARGCGVPERMLQVSDVAQACILPLTTSSSCVPREITLHLTLSAYKQ
eukprot:g37492.t1